MGKILLLHALGTLIFGYALYYQLFKHYIPRRLFTIEPNLIGVAKWPGKWKYLTVWNLVLLTAFQVLSFVNDILGSNVQDIHKRSKLQRFRDYAFASVVFPVGFFVSMSFWGLYAVDRKLVYPHIMDKFVPTLFNHAVHTGPVVFLVIESFIVPKIFPKRSTSLMGNAAFTTAYLLWILWVAHVSGVWVYPVLEVLNTPARIVFIAGSVLLFAGMYLIGEKLQRLIWGTKGLTETGIKEHPKELKSD